VEQLEAVQRRRKAAPAQNRARKADKRPAAADGDRTVEIPRSVQRRAEQAYQRRQRQERERAERERIQQRERERRQEARMIAKADKARNRAIEAYVTHGMTRSEAEYYADREPEYEDVGDPRTNPRRRRVQTSAHRNPADREALAIAAGILAVRSNPSAAAGRRLGRRVQTSARPRIRRRNPALGAVAGEIVKDVLKGGLIAAAQEEAKEWRDRLHKGGFRYAVRAELAEQRRRNPARLEPHHPDPRLREISRRFHGVETEILHLDPEQRRPPPVHVVRIGEERAITYRPSRRSERGDADWEHSAGDQGPLRRNASGRRLLVADERGRVYVIRGTSRMRFDPDRGLVK
jgi:hypothetical protein